MKWYNCAGVFYDKIMLIIDTIYLVHKMLEILYSWLHSETQTILVLFVVNLVTFTQRGHLCMMHNQTIPLDAQQAEWRWTMLNHVICEMKLLGISIVIIFKVNLSCHINFGMQLHWSEQLGALILDKSYFSMVGAGEGVWRPYWRVSMYIVSIC